MDTLGFSLDTESSTCFCEPTLSVQRQHHHQPYQLQSSNKNQKLCFLKSSKNQNLAHSLPKTARPLSDFTRVTITSSDANGNDLSGNEALQLNSDRSSRHISISYIEKSDSATLKSALPCQRLYHNHQPLSIEQFNSNQQFDSNHRSLATPLFETKISISLSTIPQSCCNCYQPSSFPMNQSSRSLSNEQIDRSVTRKNNNKLLIKQEQGSSKKRRTATSQLAVHSNETFSASTANYYDNKNTDRRMEDRNVTRTATKTRQVKKQSLKETGVIEKTKNSKQTNYQVDMSDSNASNTDSSSAADADNYNDLMMPMYKVPKNDNNNKSSNEESDNRVPSGHKISLPLIISPVAKQKNYFYSNQININQSDSLIGSSSLTYGTSMKKSSSSMQKLSPLSSRGNPLPTLPEYFTALAMKPSYEQIADSITADNIQQLYKWVLDGFGNQVYSWRNAFVLADSSARMKDFMTQIPKYQVSTNILKIPLVSNL